MVKNIKLGTPMSIV